MIEAERLLFQESLQDPANQRFVLLSDRLSSLQLIHFTKVIIFMLLYVHLLHIVPAYM